MRSRNKALLLSVCLAAAVFGAVTAGYANAKRKMDLIAAERYPAGTQVVFNQDELNAYVRQQVATLQGVREPKLVLGSGTATGSAYVDFPKLRESQGEPMNWVMARLLAGERPVEVETHIRSSGGKAVVDVDRVEVSGMTISGSALDFLIHNYLEAYYPDAKIGQPFELAHHIDRLEVRPGQARVVIGR